MKWHHHETSFDTAARCLPDSVRGISREEYYGRICAGIDQRNYHQRQWGFQCNHEYTWEKNHRPFYNVWPSVVEGLARLSLKLPNATLEPYIKAMPRAVNLRYAEGHELEHRGCKVRSVLVCRITTKNPSGVVPDDGLAFLADLGERRQEFAEGQVPVYATSRFSLMTPGSTVEDEIKAIPNAGDQTAEESEVMLKIIRTYLSIALMRADSDLIDSVVLRRDQEAYQQTQDRELVQRARAKGVVGWDIGRDIEVSPHYRRAHFGIRWTGPGAAIPKVVPIKGSVVHRERLQAVPTGYDKPKE